MRMLQDALREVVRDFFQQFAYLDIELKPGPDAPAPDWTLSSRILCDGGEVEILVFMRPAFARVVAEGFLGRDECELSQVKDLVLETSNVLAGQVYEIVHAGRKPQNVGQPVWVSEVVAQEKWKNTDGEQRYAIFQEDVMEGGLIVRTTEAWSGQWE